jgi:hypothetical protein
MIIGIKSEPWKIASLALVVASAVLCYRRRRSQSSVTANSPGAAHLADRCHGHFCLRVGRYDPPKAQD